MKLLCILALAVCLVAYGSAKLDKFHVIKTHPVNMDEPIPTFDDLRQAFAEQESQKEMDSEVVEADDEVIVISAVQVLKVFLRNPGEEVEEVMFRDFLPSHSLIEDFHVRNRGFNYRAEEKSSLADVEKHFLGADEEMRSTALLGMIHSSSTHDDIKWLEPEDLKALSDDEWQDMVWQEPAILIRLAPHDVFSFRVAFREVIPANPDYVKDMYRSHLTAHLGTRGVGLQGLFESPNYPFAYPDNGDIKWLIRLPPNRNFGITVNVQDFETESCCDRLYIYDGPVVNSPTIGMMSGSLGDQVSTSYNSTGADMLLEFRSDCFVNNGSFSFNFTSFTFPPVVACGDQENIAAPEGYITSANYPIDYPEEAHCDWLIKTPRRTTVVLEIVDFQIDGRDLVRIYEIFRTGSEAIADLSGTVEPYTLYGHSDTMEIILDSADHIISRRGFVFHFTSKDVPQPCEEGVVLEDSSGEISSNSYPSNYDNNQNCSWQIRAGEGNVVYMNIDDFNTEEYYDILYIYDGPSENDKLIAAISGNQGLERAYMTDESIATLVFVSDYSNTDTGFHLTYESYAQSVECSNNTQLVSGQQGYLTTPYYPDPFPGFVACTWIVQTDIDTVLSLTLVDVNLGRESTNLLTIYDGSSSNGRVLFSDNYIRLDEALTINATQNQVLVTLNTGDNWEDRGFIMRFEQIDMKTLCTQGFTLTGAQGQLESPLYPGYYPSGYTCTYYIVTPVFTNVELLTKEFQLGPTDKLTAYDGDSDKAPLLFECTNKLCPILPATRNDMFLVFESSSNNVGFSFNYYGTAETCQLAHQPGGEGPQTGFIISPEFPSNYPNNKSCEWTITGLFRDIVEIEILGMQTESCCDWLRIYDGDSRAAPLLEAVSGVHENVLVKTSGNNAFIAFDVDYSVTYRGFTLRYSKYRPKEEYDASGDDGSGDAVPYECTAFDHMDEGLNDTHGYVVSPGYSTNYPNDLDYCWYFHLPQRILEVDLTFARVQTELYFDFIQVFKGDVMYDENLIEELTGDYVSFTARVPGNMALVRFHTDESVTDKGFVLQYAGLY